MTIEEKILELLTQMDGRMNRMEAAQEEMQATITKVALTQENGVLPQLKLLAEGHETLLDTLAPKSRVEKLEEELDLLKTVIRVLTKDVAELKKAQ